MNIRIPCLLKNKISAFLAFFELQWNLELMHSWQQYHNRFFHVLLYVADFLYSFSEKIQDEYKLMSLFSSIKQSETLSSF